MYAMLPIYSNCSFTFFNIAFSKFFKYLLDVFIMNMKCILL